MPAPCVDLSTAAATGGGGTVIHGPGQRSPVRLGDKVVKHLGTPSSCHGSSDSCQQDVSLTSKVAVPFGYSHSPGPSEGNRRTYARKGWYFCYSFFELLRPHAKYKHGHLDLIRAAWEKRPETADRARRSPQHAMPCRTIPGCVVAIACNTTTYTTCTPPVTVGPPSARRGWYTTGTPQAAEGESETREKYKTQ
ncbi:hypothetical protein L226DRAFT_13821 [Lentinus tigrinus ALCF2SS1-7]|uniref:uncharacterized protein n=1 Tax=Lentinus tigrinus ALCF2SS1-7 TaxID=1328758 RepID=UPI001165FAEC|nr:hypothetical protein L226DRAFT_13821 [Lentinus tigrinus ALCF2SS1-7]